MKKKCGVCYLEYEELEMTDIYMGMGSTQYVCEECGKGSFYSVQEHLDRKDSPVYVGNTLFEDLYK